MRSHRFVNSSENAFAMFTMFTSRAKSLKTLSSFVNAGEQNCSRSFASVHERERPRGLLYSMNSARSGPHARHPDSGRAKPYLSAR